MSKNKIEGFPPVTDINTAPGEDTPDAPAVPVTTGAIELVEAIEAPKRRGRPRGAGNGRKIVEARDGEAPQFHVRLRVEHIVGNAKTIYDRAGAPGKGGVPKLVNDWVDDIRQEIKRSG